MTGGGADVTVMKNPGQQRVPQKWQQATALLETTRPVHLFLLAIKMKTTLCGLDLIRPHASLDYLRHERSGSTGLPSVQKKEVGKPESTASSKWHAWFASRCPGRCLYLADDCRRMSNSTRRSQRSADISTCVVPRTLGSPVLPLRSCLK